MGEMLVEAVTDMFGSKSKDMFSKFLTENFFQMKTVCTKINFDKVVVVILKICREDQNVSILT